MQNRHDGSKQVVAFLPPLLIAQASLFCLLLAGCGYTWMDHNGTQGTQKKISVPYIEGDATGALTSEIIRSLAASGMLDVRQSQADYRLQISVVQSASNTIGYRRDRQDIRGEIKKNLIASEIRKTVGVDVAIYRERDQKLLFGPYRVEADAEYDYIDGDSIQDLEFVSPSGVPTVVLPFSLGQLEPKDSADEAASRPLYAHLARKILDLIFVSWYVEDSVSP